MSSNLSGVAILNRRKGIPTMEVPLSSKYRRWHGKLKKKPLDYCDVKRMDFVALASKYVMEFAVEHSDTYFDTTVAENMLHDLGQYFAEKAEELRTKEDKNEKRRENRRIRGW